MIRNRFLAALLLCAAFTQPLSALTVTTPPAGSSAAHAGNDFATQVIGDAWDMSNFQDVDTDESAGLASQAFSPVLFSASASNCPGGVAFYPQFVGDGAQIVAIKRGPRFPINTSTYRYFTIKLKTSTAQQTHMFFLKDGDSYATATYGTSHYQATPANQWVILTWDLYTDTYGPVDGYQLWTSFPQVQGIRFDPCNAGSATIQVDWIRLTAAPTSANMYTVIWTDAGSGPYTVAAVDSDNATYTFTTAASGTSYSADLSRLAPGDYHIQVSRSGASATSVGVVHVNSPPQINITAPSIRGEQSLSYALVQQGSQWAVPMNSADFQSVTNFTNITYSNPLFPGSFSGRPTTGDPSFVMKTTGHLIDASYYRSVCFTMQVFGSRNFADGWIARLLWGVNSSPASITTSKDIIVDTGLLEYCLPDLADTTVVPLVAGSPQPWAGNLGYFRLDPAELTPPNGCSTPQTCHDVRLDSVILAPFAEASPSYTAKWTLTDSDYSGSGGGVQLYLDPDKTFGNGNEILLASLPFAMGAQQDTFTTNANGTFHFVVFADDGVNTIAQYAGGPIIVHSDRIFQNGFE